MGKRILFSLSFLSLCFSTLSAQADAPFPSKPPVVTGKAGTEMKIATIKSNVNVKPAPVAGKGLTTTKAVTSAPQKPVDPKTSAAVKAKTPSVKTPSKAVATTKTKAKKAKSKSKIVASKGKSKAAVKPTVKAKAPTAVAGVKPKVPTGYAKVVKKVDSTTSKGIGLAPQTSVVSFNKEMLAAVNALRKSGTTCGNEKMSPVKPLAWNAKLENASVIHAIDMDKNDHFSHAGTNGTLPDDRIKSAGYEWSRVGENIGQGYKDVATAVKGWQVSPNHCKQMMSADVKEIGAAKKGKYWVQKFAAPIQ